ncbi:MAG: glycoside hydrolase family 43 protein [Treponema sp.]|nr:glycoside hydrolase family 43 protein [Treponema sp.]
MKKTITSIFITLFCIWQFYAQSLEDFVYSKYLGTDNPVQGQWGTLNCHDPKIFQDDDGTFYVYSTDASIGDRGRKGLQIRKSKDLVNWECLSDSALQDNWDKPWLEWVGFEDEEEASSWAPSVIKQNGLYYMLHGIITDRINKNYPSSEITLAIADNPEGPFYPASVAVKKNKNIARVLKKLGVKYKSSGIVRYSMQEDFNEEFNSKSENFRACYNNGLYNTQTGEEFDFISWLCGFGCIDPEFVMDVETGNLMEYEIKGQNCYALSYGSWKGGIALIYLDKNSLKPVNPVDGKIIDFTADSVPNAFGTAIAGGYGAAYEGSQIIFNSKTSYYYLFVSMGNLEHDYRVGVGRSKNLCGPYFDASGKSMLLDGITSSSYHTIGSKIKGAFQAGELQRAFRCQGGQSILRAKDGKILFACHSRTNFLPGWYFYLQINQMFFNQEDWPVLDQNEYFPLNDDDKINDFTLDKIAGTYEVVITVRDNKTGDFKAFSYDKPVEANLADAIPTISKIIDINSEGLISGAYSGRLELNGKDENGNQFITVFLTHPETSDAVGVFKGFVLNSYNWNKKDLKNAKIITISLLDSEKSGEYLFGNRL